jgi:hypothetical protein
MIADVLWLDNVLKTILRPEEGKELCHDRYGIIILSTHRYDIL